MITFTQLGSMGRLCNQIFQLSCAIALALRNNDQYYFPQWKEEKHFNLHNCFSNNIKATKIYTEPYFHYKKIPYDNTKNEILDLVGFFQSPLYFEDYKKEIMELLTPNYHVEREAGLCGIHIRRDDYKKFQDCHPLLGLDYYYKAIEMSECEKFLIFSDDIKYCKDNFRGNMFEFSEEAPYVDLALMIKKCEHMIIANSSFSLIGALFNQSESKKVIAPRVWFGPKLNHDVKNLLPLEWKRI